MLLICSDVRKGVQICMTMGYLNRGVLGNLLKPPREKGGISSYFIQ